MGQDELKARTHDDQVIESIASLFIDYWFPVRKKIQSIYAESPEFNMPISNIQLLSLLSRVESLTISQISERFGIAKPNITPMVDRMVAEGLVERQRSTVDKRVVSVIICDKGRERLNQIRARIYHVVRDWANTRADGEAEDMLNALSTVIRLMSDGEEIGALSGPKNTTA